ncbi:MAG: hypothetical protein IPN11_00940 [Opitutaceae bacterium]|nr:hypothetical protein [Opitutaceae bacterium]
MLPGLAFADGESPSPPASAPVSALPSAQIVISGGFDYSRGDYGFATDTEVLAVPLNLSYETETWTFRVSQPWLRIKGPAGVVVTRAPFGSTAARPVSSTESGMGDIMAGATYRFSPSVDGFNVALTGRVKFGTADEAEGLGSGETDYYTQIDFSRAFGATVPFFSAGYRFLGRSNLYPLRDGAYLSGGVIRRLSGPTQIGLAVDWRQQVVDGGDHGCEVTGFVMHRLDERWSLQGYALAGLTDASPDVGFGGLLSYHF